MTFKGSYALKGGVLNTSLTTNQQLHCFQRGFRGATPRRGGSVVDRSERSE